MKLGTKSLLFGIHQVFWHPLMVLMAWVYLYGRPSFKELVCIIVHDWGYWGKAELDGPKGILHPRLGAYLVHKWFGFEYWKLCTGHSRGYVAYLNKMNHKYIENGVITSISTSKLCWADKLSFCFEPRWFYLLRARLSGELKVIRQEDHDNHKIYINRSDNEWFDKSLENFRNIPEFAKLLSWKKYNNIIK